MDESNKEVRRAKTELVNQLTKVGIEESEAKKEISILFKEFSEDNLVKIKEIVSQRIKDRTPLQYLLKKAYFMDFEVKVDTRVLIPRPETEILVEETVKRLLKSNFHPEQSEGSNNVRRSFANAQDDTITALDIGTGSGVIPIALAKLIPNIKIIAIDLKEDIIDLALENVKKFSLESKINFNQCDLFSIDCEEIFKLNDFDLIISNPPYVKEVETRRGASLQAEIIHEPNIALYGSRDNITGLIYYERIIELMNKHFVTCHPEQRLLALEIDWPLVDGLKDLLRRENLNNYEIIKDYAKLDRYLFIYF